MSDDSDKPTDSNGDTLKLERPDFGFEEGADGTQEIDPDSIEIIEESEVDATPPPEPSREESSSDSPPGESTQVIERDRLHQAAREDADEERPPDARTTDQMSAIDDTTRVYDEPPKDVDDTTSAYTVPRELLEEASAGSSKTQKMGAVSDETAEFDGSTDQWLEVDESGMVRCFAEVDEDGRLIIPEQLIREGILRAGMKIVLEAQIVRTDD